MMTAERLDVAVSMTALLGGDIVISRLSLVRPDILLERDETGLANWVFGSDETQTRDTPNENSGVDGGSGKNDADIPLIEIPIAEIVDGQVRYIDRASGSNMTLRDISAELRMPALDQLISFAGALTYGARAITLAASAQMPAGFAHTTPIPFGAEIAVSEGGALSLEGTATLSGRVTGDVSMDIANTHNFLSAFDVTVSGLSPNLGAQVKASTKLALDDRALTLSDFVAQLGANRVSGRLMAKFSEVPDVSGALNVGTFDLRSPQTVANASGFSNEGSASSAIGWSQEPLDIGALELLNADLNVTGDALITDTLQIEGFSGQIRIDNARAVLTLDELNAYRGAGAGEVVLNALNGLSTAIKFQGNAVDLNPLMSDLLDISSIEGRANVNLDLLGGGSSVDGIMKSLSGTAGFNVDSGRWTGMDLDRVLQSGDTTPGTTVFDNLSASSTLKNGVASNDDLIFSLPSFETRGAGQIDIGNRNLDYTLTPNAKSARSGEGLAIPVRIHGLWDAPKFQPDLNAAVNLNFAEEKAALEAKAKERIEAEKQKLEERAKQALGDALPDAKNVEDALKKELEKGAAGGLLKLLGNN
jgi:AsmA protein